ncbi:MAG: hypothetical protein R2690_10090 [Acidimicrobiales bacterium]
MLLGRLSVIAGPSTLILALGTGADDAGEARTAAALASLSADKSLLVVGAPSLETVRDYAASKLAAAGGTTSARPAPALAPRRRRRAGRGGVARRGPCPPPTPGRRSRRRPLVGDR